MVLVVKNPPANAGDIRHADPWVKKIPGGGNGNPFQYSCMENSIESGTWWAAIHRVTESDTTEATWHAFMFKGNTLFFAACHCAVVKEVMWPPGRPREDLCGQVGTTASSLPGNSEQVTLC